MLVKVGGKTITLGEFADRLSEQSPYLRARYNSPERRREFLDNLVRFELLAAEARERGYDKLPDVEHTRRQMMIQELMREEFEGKIRPEDVTDAEVRAYYEAHPEEFHQPEQVRASVILIRDAAAARRVRAQLEQRGADIAVFRDLAARHNEDAATKDRFGDLRFFSRPAERAPGEPEVEPAVAEAAFSLAQIGDVAPSVIETPRGFFIVKLTGRRPALARSLEEASRPIRNRLWREKREAAVDAFIAGLRRSTDVQVHDEALADVHIDVPAPEAIDPEGSIDPEALPEVHPELSSPNEPAEAQAPR